ncbi:protease inhibitor I9 family protein, partial [Nonomuraea rhizosphaerae]|uniref:protease inhibitor I9 family protein n=1 Tax=Nonomuraea rhizosphaerae TaxID=2665663 RepID=UPI001C5FAFB9
MPRRIGLPSLYLAAAVATAVTTAVPLAMTPASGLASRSPVTELSRPYIVTARDRAAARDLVGEVRWRVRRFYTAALPGFATWLSGRELAELRTDPRVVAIEPDRRIRQLPLGSPARPAPSRGTGKGVTVYLVDGGIDRDEASGPVLGGHAYGLGGTALGGGAGQGGGGKGSSPGARQFGGGAWR